MRTVMSASGDRETVTVRRSESADALEIDSLINSLTQAVFGKINVISILERANLAVNVADEKGNILAHASFSDHPVGTLVDQADWEPFLHTHFCSDPCTPLNTLFLHLFVAQTSFASACAKETMSAVFDSVPELQHICLVSPYTGDLEAALAEVFVPMQRRTEPGPQCSALICLREDFSPRLHVRPARMEDHDDIMHLYEGQTPPVSPIDLVEMIEAEDHHSAVSEVDGVVVGFFTFAVADVKQLHGNFDLREFDGLNNVQQHDQDEPEDKHRRARTPPTQQEELQLTGGQPEIPRVFRIHVLVFDKFYKTRSAACIAHIFQRFPDARYCMITVPPPSPEFPLLQNMVRVPVLPSSLMVDDLYVVHRADLSTVKMRPAVVEDRPAISGLVRDLNQGRFLLQDLDSFYQTRAGPDSVPLQAFVAQVDSQVVGVLIARDEQDLEYLRGHYYLENFIYFSHHGYEEHALLRHFVLKRCFQHFTKHFFKEVLRLAHKSCLHHRVYPPPLDQEGSCVHPLDVALKCAVPVCPRQQIIFPLEELGINSPSGLLTEEQTPFALGLISRKLTLEPRVAINARIVVVGASDTALSFLEVLCLCPHLRFNNLVLISTHGFPGNHHHEEAGFLCTSHSYSSRDLVQIPLRPSISVVTGKMVSISRTSRYVLVSGGQKVLYDHLFLCTGLQYQVPCPIGGQPIRESLLPPQPADCNYPRPRPSNLFTINDLHDSVAVRRWLCAGFLELEDQAIVYGNNLDVYTTVETLLSLGIRGSRIHLVLPPPKPGVSCFTDLAVEKAVTTAMMSSGVQVHRDVVLAKMNNGGECNHLTSASFSSYTEPLHLQCGVFINLSSKGVDGDAFRSISKSGLAFDGRLIINAMFSTRDPAIFAAGPLTRYSYGYYTKKSHEHFNSKEVGQNMAAMFLSLLDAMKAWEESTSGVDRPVPLYKQPKIQGGKLPGGYNYLHVTKPADPDMEAPAEPRRRAVVYMD
ncbi:cilia- and flagella-associated protein 61 isoform X2 [Melanotaenia boesemani]|uniref:cilia- and flagella-associated protein 61 isoform X2 n=1 Tax=Melanotaenia boesemani TaxID=1250792 RepID=UPI001C03AF00|nr:cilia- and flagella-associated protein 61 isoform X2 [Melanotaenia boesemani]